LDAETVTEQSGIGKWVSVAVVKTPHGFARRFVMRWCPNQYRGVDFTKGNEGNEDASVARGYGGQGRKEAEAQGKQKCVISQLRPFPK